MAALPARAAGLARAASPKIPAKLLLLLLLLLSLVLVLVPKIPAKLLLPLAPARVCAARLGSRLQRRLAF